MRLRFVFGIFGCAFSQDITLSSSTIISPQYEALHVVRPNDPFQVSLALKEGTEASFDLLDAPPGWAALPMSLTAHGENHLEFSLKHPVTVPAVLEGKHVLIWKNDQTQRTLSLSFFVSCTDGNECNGLETLARKQNGSTVCMRAMFDLCDDRIPCTEDICAPGGFCSHKMTSACPKNMPRCKQSGGPNDGQQGGNGGGNGICVPNCRNKKCGPDGCGGQCGSDCAAFQTECQNGKCVPFSAQGTCRFPFDVTDKAREINFQGQFQVTGNTQRGANNIAPLCNIQSQAKEIMFRLDSPTGSNQFVGIEARSTSTKRLPNGAIDASALDTVLQIIEVNPSLGNQSSVLSCSSGKVVACSDDSSPPGGYSSRVTWMMKPNHVYFIQVDGFSALDVGPFLLDIRLTPDCTMRCDGVFCGMGSCGENSPSCGECPNNQRCALDGYSCIKSPCEPQCKRGPKACGSNSCEGSCGTCNIEEGEFCLDGLCISFPVCNHELPSCQHVFKGKLRAGCDVNHVCGSDCKCRKRQALLPDLAMSGDFQTSIQEDYLVLPTSCALKEGCISVTGLRRLLKFATIVYNQGDIPLNLPGPASSHPNLFEYAPCHGHYHFSDFAKFELADANTGQVLVQGLKRSYCAEDSSQYWPDHPNMPCNQQFTCESQGVSVGWQDIYDANLDCQFLDITDVPRGIFYTLKQCANTERIFHEKSFENNCLSQLVYIPE